MKILISGFDPFGGEAINPAYEAVKRLPQTVETATIKTIEIPTVFHKAADVLEKEIEAFQPDVVLCVGQAGGRFDLTLERVAINIDDARIPDNEDNQPIDQMIQTDGEPAYFATLPIKAMVTALKEAGLPASVSNTAGTFVCNHIMYQVLYYVAKNNLNIKAGFMHVPFIPEQVVTKPNQASMALDNIVKGLLICIETLVAYENKDDIKVIGGQTH